ncbi:MAG: hypothetical protein KKH22_02400 [Proteobacteria bacterium]|nr:hypothetical protein [Pseudomonadota bacterium]
MTIDLFPRLLAAATDQDKLELELVRDGLAAAMSAYQKSATKETKANWDAARDAYDEALARFSARYFPEEAAAVEGERFANRKQALNWLQAQKYKISQGKFYQDVAAGFPVLQRDGTISRYQVMQYGQQLDVEARSGAPVSGRREEDEDRKAKAEADIKEMEATKRRREEDADWLHADAAWMAIAGLLGVLKDSLRHHFHAGQGELIHLAGGDQARGPEVYEGCEELMGRAFNEVAGMGKIEGVFAKEGGE